jgi:Leucine-rich repeat (LRR) protein
MTGKPTRKLKTRICLSALLAWGCWLSGCAKVEEMAKTATETAKEKVASATSKAPEDTAQVLPQGASSSPAPPATTKVDSQKVLQEFLALAPADIRDEHLLRLAAMDASHREQVVQLDLTDSVISGEAIGALVSFPNLSALTLTDLNLASADLAPLERLNNLRSLSLDHTGGVDETTLAALAKLRNLERLTLAGVPISEAGLQSIAEIKSLKYLDLSEQTGFTGSRLALLPGLPALEGVKLDSNMNLGEAGLIELAKCKKLLDLDISSCGMADQHFSILKAWPNLRSLRCNNNALTDEGMVFLKPLNDLVELDLRNTRVTDRGFALVSSRKLERLWLTGISDQGMVLIKRFPALRELYLSESGISDLGVVQLKGLKNLSVLDLRNTSLSDRGLAELVGLKGLRRLYVTKTAVTEAGVAGIKNAIRDLEVE